MAVQKSKKSRSKRDTRRAHDSLKGDSLSTHPVSGEKHLRHHLTPEGHYGKRKFTLKKEKISEEPENSEE
jgi:large subunit ribosomal protein L32